MKVLLVNTSDVGGAGKACARLHLGLLKMDVDSTLLLVKKISDYKASYTHHQKKNNSLFFRIQNKVLRALREIKLLKPSRKTQEELFIEKRAKGLEKFSFPTSNYDITDSELYKQADVINLHWVSEFIDYQSFFKKNIKPVVWTLHDMNPFSGGEHYEEEYLGMNEKGFPIQRVLSNGELAKFKSVLSIKKTALSKVENLHFVTLCNWMTNQLKQNDFFKRFPIHKIPNGIDSNIFKIRDKSVSRDLLNISHEKKVILFVADLIDANRKGFKFLLKAIERLEQKNIQLFVIGKKNEDLNHLENVIQQGKVYNEELLSSIYSAADVFVIPSLMDNLPNTVLESLLCGTPVIGFPIGGIPDMINHKKNGIVAEEVSVDALVNSISVFLEKGVLDSAEEIRKDAVSKYDEKVQTKKYIDLFESLVN